MNYFLSCDLTDPISGCHGVFCPQISMLQFFGLGISLLGVFGLGMLMLWYMCPHGFIFVFIVKTEKITQNYFSCIVEKYFNIRVFEFMQ